jgi:hypothetical protein
MVAEPLTYQQSAIGHQLSAISYRPSAISYQLLAITLSSPPLPNPGQQVNAAELPGNVMISL